MKRNALSWKFIVVSAWLLFTTSLTIWWYIFSQRQLAKLFHGDVSAPAELLRDQAMLRSEGIVLIACLLLGGIALLYYTYREMRDKERIREFFLTFSHELKTPLTTVQLQAEMLADELGAGSKGQEQALALLSETGRLAARLENSLFLANIEESRCMPEALRLHDIISELQRDFPEMEVEMKGDARVIADKRMLSIILRNIVQNAKQHGKATQVTITLTQQDTELVCMTIIDNGTGFHEDIQKLGSIFFRPSKSSGSGIGLYVSKKLARRMQGKLTLKRPHPPALEHHLCLPGELLP